MPRREDISKVLILGSGPIVIGQACEFDYSGTQACKVLMEDGFEVVLVNSNPATIMTDPDIAYQTYIEPITAAVVARVIEKERPQALLPTLGGQTALNVAVELAESGVLERYDVELIGAKLGSIRKAEDRRLFKQAMADIGMELPRSDFANELEQAVKVAGEIGFPLVVRPSYTLGGAGGGIAFNIEELREMAALGLSLSPISEVLLEESVIGWKEYELEVMRDLSDNVVIICSIENFDAMGVHTGDSITVAPAQTLTDVEYQRLRDSALKIIREIGVETGGSNIQFAIDPRTGRQVVIEMNPRVSRSSALASKATGFPIAKMAARLAVGYRLDEIMNDITKETPACFEPTIDYVVVKMPRWAFEKFPGTDATLTTKMKSVGEAMSIGRTFKEALQKVVRSLEIGRYGLGSDGLDDIEADNLEQMLAVPNESRLFYIKHALASGMPAEQVVTLTRIDPWFIDQIAQLVEFEVEIKGMELDAATLGRAKRLGYSDRQLAYLSGSDEKSVRRLRIGLGVRPVFKKVDTCAAEFEAHTPYYYSTYETETEVAPGDRPKVAILGSGPNRIGQGIEFDYCCVHAAYALSEAGYESIMINCNPETVSTDYDTADRLYFEPLTFEDVMEVVEAEKPIGVIVQFGGQTPLKLANALEEAGVKIMGTTPDSIDLAEDRKRFGEVLSRLGIPQAPNSTAMSYEEALVASRTIGYPLLVRPSYVLGGRAMEIVYSEDTLEGLMRSAFLASPEHPVLIDKFLEGAIEVDVDAVCDGEEVLIGAVMEHIEEAGIHSGDSACVIPPYSLSEETVDLIKDYTKKLAFALSVRGLLNIQFAVRDDTVYVLEVNPRASRTVPFVSKAVGVPLAKIAAKVMVGAKLADLVRAPSMPTGYFAIKEAVLPFARFPGVDTLLGPEMRSTGEVMGLAGSFGLAYAKSQIAAGFDIAPRGGVFISVRNRHKRSIAIIASGLAALGYSLISTKGTAVALSKAGLKVDVVAKLHEGLRPNVLDRIKSGEIALIINTPFGESTRSDGYYIRTAATAHGVPCVTTMAGATAMMQALEALRFGDLEIMSVQDRYKAEARDEGAKHVV